MLNFNSLKKKLLYKKNNDFLSTSKSIFFVFLNNGSFKPFKKELQDLGYEIRFFGGRELSREFIEKYKISYKISSSLTVLKLDLSKEEDPASYLKSLNFLAKKKDEMPILLDIFSDSHFYNKDILQFFKSKSSLNKNFLESLVVISLLGQLQMLNSCFHLVKEEKKN
jgi:hypothetical protein